MRNRFLLLLAVALMLFGTAGISRAHNDEGNPYHGIFSDIWKYNEESYVIQACKDNDHRIVHAIIDHLNGYLDQFQKLLETTSDPENQKKINQEMDTLYWMARNWINEINERCGFTDTHTLPEKRGLQ